MAAKTGLSPENTDNNPSPADKTAEKKTMPPDTLMMRLRGRQYKSWNDSIKALKMAVSNDKRYSSDALEKATLQACLDRLHKAMKSKLKHKVVNQQSLVERLEVIARQLGMSFTPPSAAENRMTLSAEMFVVEIVPDSGGGVKDVRIGHHENPVTCEELIEVLSKGDFDEFISHMQGLLGIYSLKGDKKQKSKAYLALSSLEHDLNVLAQLQSSISGVANYIHKSPLGILLPRKGGHPMKLIYFVSPYDLLCKKTKSSYPMTVEAITENDLGHSVTVCLEPCSVLNKLQTMPMISVKTHPQDGKSLPSFQGLNNMNSSSLPASFVLVLPQPVPVSTSLINSIQEVTGLEIPTEESRSIYSLILEQASQGKITNGKELFVTLPDQQHIYYLQDLMEGCLGQPGAFISKIPFTHPTSVAKVLNFLRQQLLFNCVIQSLIRPSASQDYKTSLVFELTAVSHQHLSVTFEHPLHDGMMSVELDLSDITSVRCKVCMGNGDENVCSDDFVSRAFQRCLSIPVTLRTVIQRVRAEIQKLLPPEPVLVKHNKPKWKWRSERVNIPCTNVNSIIPLTTQPAQPNVDSWAHGHIETRKYFLPFQPNINSSFREPPPPSEEHSAEKPGANPLLATLLDQGSPLADQHSNPVSDSPMLSKLLEEQTPVTSNPPPAFTPPKRRLGKRKSSKDVLSGKGPKLRASESDMGAGISERIGTERHGQGIAEKHLDLDSSGGSYEGDPMRPSSVSSVGSIGGQSSTGSIIDLTDIGESHVKKLENSLDSIMMKEARMGNMNMGMNTNSQMGGPEMMDFQMPHMGDLHHGQIPHMGDGSELIHHQQWGSQPTPPRPTSRNSPHHGNMMPKNETASTSLEGNLTGPGDGRDLQGPSQTHCRRNSGHGMRLSGLRRQTSRTSVDSNLSDLISPDVFSPSTKSPAHYQLPSPHQMISPSHSSSHNSAVTSPVHHPVSSPSHFLSNVKTESSVSVTTPSSVTSPRNSCDSKSGNFHITNYNMAASLTPCSTPSPMLYPSGKPSLSALKAQLEMKNDIVNRGCVNSQEKDCFKIEEKPPSGIMKLRLNMKQYDKQYDTVSPPESDKSRSSMFDFHSDDEEFSLPHLEKSMSVVSASPTRLQISNKSKLVHTLKFNKSEKYKRKESKRNSARDSSKRKRDKDESKKEKKRKKISNNSYPKIKDNAVYKSTTVNVEGVGDNNLKPMPRLKITKSGVKFESATVVSVESSPRVKEENIPHVKAASAPHDVKNDSDSTDLEIASAKFEISSQKHENIPDKVEILSQELVKNESISSEVRNIEMESEKNESSSSSIDNAFTSVEAGVSAAKTKSTSSVEFSTSLKMASDFILQDDRLMVKIEENLHKENLKLEKIEKSGETESKFGELLDKALNADIKDKVLEKIERIRTSSSSDEGIFDKIAAMKNENIPKCDIVMDLPKDENIDEITHKKANSKSQKIHKAQRSASHYKGDSKISERTPTIKLKPVIFPSSTSSAQSRTPTTPEIPSLAVPKSVTPSPTSTTIGKIGAVSLATTGSHKHLAQSNKSPQGLNKLPSKNFAGAISSKSSGNLQKPAQIISSGGKNSPVLQMNKSGNANTNRSVSLSSLNSKVDKSVEKTGRTLSASNRTSSPQLGREKDSSKSRSSSASRDREREREKSTSSAKASVPVTSVLTQETAASVLSFLNPKASSIAKLPPIPKKLNSSDSAKNSPTTSCVTTTTSVTSVSSVSNSFTTQTTNSRATNLTSGLNPKGKSSTSKPNNVNRQIGSIVPNAASRTGNNSPVNYSAKHAGSYSNKGNSSNSVSSRSNNVNNTSNFNRGSSTTNHSVNSVTSRGNNHNQTSRGGSYPNSNRAISSNNSRGANANVNVPSNSMSNRSNASGSTAGKTSGNRNSSSVPNAPKGPGPPVSSNNPAVVLNSDDVLRSKHLAQVAARSRKGSLSAVIDKLTCKVSVPVSDSKKKSDNKGDKVVIDEPPASPEPDAVVNNDKLGSKTDKAKVVINESPESPEPETVNSSGLSAQQNEVNIQGGIVSIPLDKQTSKSPEISKNMVRISGHRQSSNSHEKRKSNKPANLPVTKSSGSNSKLTPSPTTQSQSPISIPLTPKTKDAGGPVRNKSNHKILSKQGSIDSLKSYNEETNGELLEDEDLRIILNQKPPQGYRNTPGLPGSSRSRDSTPVDFSTKKQSPNAISDNSDRKHILPNSKSASIENDVELKNHIGHQKSGFNSQHISSPESPCSSPDNGLIIDCDSSPKVLLNKTNSPLCNQDGLKKDLRTSPSFLKSVNTSSVGKFRPSPGTSPTLKDRGSDSSSPCYIDDDDDLMDLALTGDGTEN